MATSGIFTPGCACATPGLGIVCPCGGTCEKGKCDCVQCPGKDKCKCATVDKNCQCAATEGGCNCAACKCDSCKAKV